MRILVFGGNGMLGHKLVQRLGGRFDVWAAIREPFAVVRHFGILDEGRTVDGIDVRNTDNIRQAIERAAPDVVINAAGIIKQVTEADDASRLLAVNSVFPHQLALLADQNHFRLISISTDCVFSGDRGSYTERDLSDASDMYGVSKFLGEVTDGDCLTIRTSIVGRELGSRHSIVEWFLSNRGGSVRGYTNAIYTGFPTVVFADILADIIENHTGLRGLYHVSSDPISKFDLLGLLNTYFDAGVSIEPFADHVIDRSLDSTLFRQATGFVPPAWDKMIEAMADDPTPYDTWSRSTAAS
jgi:dTDP-4-dehydrorhamnose reductase